ncbi:unnamed protein product [Candidula unifasciata]|uniref:Cytochrome P450 n=1 Tax=Candidula unifasciata TaxID=100452 RepID=A0A8S3ZMR1_9EUPU|nr:unnamed protein product [Candidula unifasciata]
MDVATTFLSTRSVLIAIALTFLGYYIWRWISSKSPKNLPPGPREWGTNWKFLKASWYGTLPELAAEWARKYGPLTFVYSMGQPILFLNTPEVSRKLLASDEYKLRVADREPNAAFKIVDLHNRDLLFSKFDTAMKKKRRLFFNRDRPLR